MSTLIQTITRISPVHMWSNEAFSNLLAPEHLGRPSRVENCLVTDPRSGMQYRMETAFIFENNYSANQEIDIALRCKQIPGMIPAINGNLMTNFYLPNNSFFTLNVPKVISSNVSPAALSVQKNKSNMKKKPADTSIKVQINLKDLEKKPQNTKKLKRQLEKKKKLIEPLLQYFIDNECLICGYIALYESEENSSEHMKKHIRQNSYVCDCCRKIFNSASELYKHKIDRTKKKPYACEVCNKKFKRNYFLTSHIKTDHALAQSSSVKKKSIKKNNFLGPNFTCTICDKRFQNWWSIRDHKRYHAGLERFRCTLCAKKFFNSSFLVHHKHVHPTDKNYKCKICKKSFKSYRRLEEHKRSHKRKQLFSCEKCNEKFYLQNKLVEHYKIVHNLP